ncbi:MAG: tetratricopeptide repeat protein [Anaerolineae bacterium]|nr:tetratricopeptide repeat protein [Anaerolineae bacterium]
MADSGAGFAGDSSGQRRRALPPLEEGIALAQAGEQAEARTRFQRLIQSDPSNEEAWLWLAWVAEGKDRALAYLREAQAFLPESQRIRQAMTWAEQGGASLVSGSQAPASSGEGPPFAQGGVLSEEASGDVAALGEDESRSEPPRRASPLGETARAARETISHMVGSAQQRLGRREGQRGASRPRFFEGWRLPEVVPPTMGRMRGGSLPLLAVLLLVAMAAIVWAGIVRARRDVGVAQALVLPTMVLDATATPTVEDRCQTLWVQVDVAWTRNNWDASIEALERIRAIDPYSDEARARLAEAHFNRGVSYIEENRLDEARLELDTAIRLDAESEPLQETRRQLHTYLSGLDAYWQQDWERATERLGRLYKRNPTFRDTQTMLAESYYRYGVVLQDQERWEESAAVYEQALGLWQDAASGAKEDALVRLQVVNDIITPPKRIEVDLSDKTVTLYENGEVLDVFRVCTGRREAPTLPGRYEVLDKLPEAYASKWDLRMPWWLGIYWAGGSENGFHALPILSNGRTLWSGSLGTGCSFGCIVLDTDDAIMMYNWAEIGDVVIIYP